MFIAFCFTARLSNRKVNPDAYSKDMKDNIPNRLGANKRAKNEPRGSSKPKASNANLSAGSSTPQRRTSQRQ